MVLLFNVLHAHDPDEAEALVERAADALAPDGRLFVLDQYAGTGRTALARTGVALSGVVYRTALGGQLHEYDAVADWLRSAGLTDVTRETSLALPGTPLVWATKPG